MSRSVRQRTFDRAAVAWNDGKPHKAWEVLASAGLADLWPAFLRHATGAARKRYRAAMARYQR